MYTGAPSAPLYGLSCGGVKTLKTRGGGAAGSMGAWDGRRRMYTKTMKRENSTRFIGVAIAALVPN
jgi:hypothetical protein